MGFSRFAFAKARILFNVDSLMSNCFLVSLRGDIGSPHLNVCPLLVLGEGFWVLIFDRTNAVTVLSKSDKIHYR
jgi:hypothetical protein